MFQETLGAVDEQVDRLGRLEAELRECGTTWRLYPVVQALQALRGVQWLVAIQALRTYFVNFLKRTDWHRRPASTVVDEQGTTSPLAALEQLRTRLRTRHYSHRTECTYVVIALPRICS